MWRLFWHFFGTHSENERCPKKIKIGIITLLQRVVVEPVNGCDLTRREASDFMDDRGKATLQQALPNGSFLVIPWHAYMFCPPTRYLLLPSSEQNMEPYMFVLAQQWSFVLFFTQQSQ